MDRLRNSRISPTNRPVLESPPDRPIVVVGAAKSGTRIVPRILRDHPEIAYWDEPNYVWKAARMRASHDVVSDTAITLEELAKIRNKFNEYVRSSQRSRLCEKTPANCLRLPLVLKALPDAKVIHIVRDGRDVAISAMRRWTGRSDVSGRLRNDASKRRAIWRRDPVPIRRMRNRLTQGREAVLYGLWHFPDMSRLVLNDLGVLSSALWGPRVPGLGDLHKSMPVLETCAIQWRFCVESCLSYFLDPCGSENCNVWTVRHEDLCSEPRRFIDNLFEFVGLEPHYDPAQLAERIERGNRGFWKEELTAAEINSLHIHLSSTLAKLGYDVYGPR